jgi:hypothetical protein
VFLAHRIGYALPRQGETHMALDAFETGGSSPPRPDLIVSGGGSIYLLFATSSLGEAWVNNHIPDDAQWFAGGVAVEHRYIGEIVAGAVADGLRVQ